MPIPSGNLVTPVGQREDGTIRSLLIDNSDRIHVVDSLSAGDSMFSQEISDATAPAGTNIMNFTTVPSGEIHHIQAINGLNQTSGTNNTRVSAIINGVEIVLFQFIGTVASQFTIWSGRVSLGEGDNIRVTFFGVTLNDFLIARASGVISKRVI